jgi:hypothetical protein
MATYQTVELTNIPLEGCIQISCTATDEPVGDITSIKVMRRIKDTPPWVVIAEIEVAVVADFTFTAKDYNVKSRYTYDYLFVPCAGEEEIEDNAAMSTMKCSFDGIYIADATARYMLELNAKYTLSGRNMKSAYVELLNSPYPHRIQNGSANYDKGSVSAIVLPRSVSGIYSQEASQTAEARSYKDDYMSFLVNGLSKTLKTYDGYMKTIGVDENPTETVGDADGASETSFNWTEIAPPPSVGLVMLE